MAKKRITKLDVLALLKEGKTVQEIAETKKVRENAVFSHIRRLKAQHLWDGNGHKPEPLTKKEYSIDDYVDNILKRIEHVTEIEDENTQLKDKIKELDNIIAAKDNELAVKNDEITEKERLLIPRKEAQERIKKLEAKLRSTEMKLSQEAQD